MRSRKLPALEKAVAAAEKAGMEKRLGVQLAMARRILEQLRRIEKLRNAVMNLDQPTIAEIKSYSNPPVAVNHVMTATFLLLGESEKRMQVSKMLISDFRKYSWCCTFSLCGVYCGYSVRPSLCPSHS